MSFIEELKSRRDLLADPQNLVSVDGSSLGQISERLRSDYAYQRDMRVAEMRKNYAWSSCADRS